MIVFSVFLFFQYFLSTQEFGLGRGNGLCGVMNKEERLKKGSRKEILRLHIGTARGFRGATFWSTLFVDKKEFLGSPAQLGSGISFYLPEATGYQLK